jgi:hypothetical protein
VEVGPRGEIIRVEGDPDRYVVDHILNDKTYKHNFGKCGYYMFSKQKVAWSEKITIMDVDIYFIY